MKRLLIVDDDRRMRRTLQVLVEGMGLESIAAASAFEAREALGRQRFDLVISDLKMPGTSGIELLEEVRREYPETPVVLVTAFGTIQTAIDAMRKGASDFILKPFDNKNLEVVIRRALELEQVRAENAFLKEQIASTWAAEDVFLSMPNLEEVRETITRVAATPSPVLVTGETGSGKELAARAIHRNSDRRDRLFVPINCAALPGDLLEAELFGHARGAFTGADRQRKGKFEVADGGTIFLDELGDMPLALQAKLLRVLEDSVIEPLGTNERIRVDVRLISATNQDLREAIREKRFRNDLFFRLNTFEVRLPPLRERPDDVELLAPLFLEKLAREFAKGPVALSPDALQLLRAYDWPGNVRELRNLMERAAVLSNEATVGASVLANLIGSDIDPPRTAVTQDPPAEDLPLPEAVDRFERQRILRALGETDDNKAKAARQLGISERNLWYKLKKHGL